MPLDAAFARDEVARASALTDLDRTLLVQAGAGSGKTSVLAGRVVMLLATGRHPSSVAAISFTEFSAAELRERIVRFIDQVLAGTVPKDLRAAFPGGKPTPEQRASLEQANRDLDCLVCQTIHGFCGMMLRPYPVEAAIDPGAAMLNQDEAELLFEEEVTEWIRGRLSGEYRPDDVFTTLYLTDARNTADLLRNLARALRARRGAEVEYHPEVTAELNGLRQAVAEFCAFLNERGTGKYPECLLTVADALDGQAEAAPEANEAGLLTWLIGLQAPEGCATAKGELSATRTICTKKAWEATLGGGKGTKALVDELNQRAAGLYEACRDAHAAMQTAAAGRILHIMADEARDVLRRYDRAKQEAARLDFDDLLFKTKVLLASHPEVCAELRQRFPTVLVDEFQDTDPVQLEILWRLCGEPPADDAEAKWRGWQLRPGSLFLVGDPKQSIYRFRGADLNAFVEARDMLENADPTCRLEISRNFRSRPGILTWVNSRFEVCLKAEGQCGFNDLIPDVEDVLEMPGVAVLDLDCDGASADGIRDAEADEAANLCLRLVGSVMVRDREADEGVRPCEPRDIALLVPTNTDLWRYERALEDAGLTVSTQAGKGFYRRQEVQDLIALARALADDRDRLALGALLRGPLVGFPDEVLLDAVAAQPTMRGASGDPLPAQLSLRMDLDRVPNPLLRATLEKLQSLARQRRTCTPHILLCRAVEAMNVRAILRERGGRVAELALANVDLFLEMSRAYDVRGLRAFAERMRERWEDAASSLDARPDADLRSISLVTMHSSKGLEWPVVIPVNTASKVMEGVRSAHNPQLNRLHVSVFGIHPRGCKDALDQERREQRFERQRLWYVATTRPRDLLMIPRLKDGGKADGWVKLVELGLEELEPFGDDFPAANIPLPPSMPNTQDRVTFEAEADTILTAEPRIRRITPHLSEGTDTGEAPVMVSEDVVATEGLPTRGGLARGLILHKLLEEVLTGETREAEGALVARATALLGQTPLSVEGFDPAEMAQAVLRGLAVPEIAAVRDRLVAEWPVARSEHAGGWETVTLGVADAVALEADETCSLVVDWKSDINPDEGTIARYRGQLREYLANMDAPKGVLVFLSFVPPLTVPVGP